MAVMLTSLLLGCLLQAPGSVPTRQGTLGVQLDRNGWPVVQEAPVRPGLDSWPPSADRSSPREAGLSAVNSRGTAVGAARSAAPTAGGAAERPTSSPLSDLFASVQTPAAFAALRSATVWWRITVYGEQGKIGQREVTHLADLTAADRDRLEFSDGRVTGRLDGSVFAERYGRPWPLLAAAAGPELELFGLHLRMPWIFADQRQFAATGTRRVDSEVAPMLRLALQRRPAPGPVGPPLAAAAVDRFELLCPVGGAPPRELVHELASSGQRRRVLLEDWREVHGVKMSFRRIYVDAGSRPTTMLEILRIETGVPVDVRAFRLQ